MLIQHKKDKQANLVLYIKEKYKRYLSTDKLYWIMYICDFMQYMDVGYSITGLKYYKHGNMPIPIPVKFENRLIRGKVYNKYFKPEFWKYNKCDVGWVNNDKVTRGCLMCNIMEGLNWFNIENIKQPFDKSHFSKRNIEIMDYVINSFNEREKDEDPFFDTWHEYFVFCEEKFFKINPFDKTKLIPNQKYSKISYNKVLENIIEGSEREAVAEAAKEHKEFSKSYKKLNKE